MKGTLTVVVGPPKAGKETLARFLAERDLASCVLYRWRPWMDAEPDCLAGMQARAEAGEHVIVMVSRRKREQGNGTAALFAAADQVIEIQFFSRRDSNANET